MNAYEIDEHTKVNIHILCVCGEGVCPWKYAYMYVSVSTHMEAID